jgi:hypothetical protein
MAATGVARSATRMVISLLTLCFESQSKHFL